jgi:hypothetical protein
MDKYIKKLVQYIDKSENILSKRENLVDFFGITEKEYLGLLKYERSLLKKLMGRVFDTEDYDFFGNYDFKFKLVDVTINTLHAWKQGLLFDTPLRLYFEILPEGVLTIDGVDLDIDLKLISDNEWGWEIELEIKDIFMDVIKFYINFVEKSKLMESVEIYISYPE